MATEFTLPALGESIESGTLVKILVEAGQRVEEEQPIAELETDKAVMEVPSTVSGVVREILVQEGSTVKVGQAIFTFDSADGASEAAQEAAPASEAQVQIKPSEQAQQAETRDAAPPAAQAQAGQTPHTEYVAPQQVQPSTATAAPGGQSSANGSSPGDGSSSGALSAAASPNGASSGNASNGAPNSGTFTPQIAQMPGVPVAAAPSMRRLARELGVDIHQVEGSGPGGRISEDDIKNHARQMLSGAIAQPSSTPNGGAPSPTAPTATVNLPDFSRFGAVERQPLSNVRRATAAQMARSWSSVPHVTQFDQADVTGLEEFRKKYAERAQAAGGKLTVTAITLKAVSAALKKFPQFASSIDMGAGELVMKKFCHIGVAVDTERGLLVPVIRDVDKKSIVQLSAELTQVGQKARDKKTGLDEMQGGVFTITNLGGIGGTNFTPIVNTPEVAILGMARSKMQPVWMDGAFQPRLMLPLALSYDHRVIDGADGARFLRFLVELLEEPILLSLEG